MEKVFISQSHQSRLILVFLGWGMDASPFVNLRKNGFDVLAVYDYTGLDDTAVRDLEFTRLANEAERYEEVVVVAWSFGVRIAADFLAGCRMHLPVTRAIAINGTTSHVHDTKGIPQAIFNGTLEHLSEASVRKFNRRMFASAASFADYMTHAPARSFNSLKSELATFARIPAADDCSMFNLAIAGEADAIFPVRNQLAAWAGVETETMPGAPHFIDLHSILDNLIVDKHLVAERFKRAADTYSDHAGPQLEVARRLWELAAPHVNKALGTSSRTVAPRVLEIGSGCGFLTRLYLPSLPSDTQVELWDLTTPPSWLSHKAATFRQCDAETEICATAPGSYNCVLSASTIQWFNSPADFLPRMARAMAPGAIAAIAVYGPATYREISALTGRGLRYLSMEQLCDAAGKSGLEIIAANSETTLQTFTDASAMLRHMKLTGVNGNSSSTALAMKIMRALPAGQPAGLTYNPIYLILKKHD